MSAQIPSDPEPIAPQIGSRQEVAERNWLPLGIAAVVIVVIVGVIIGLGSHRKPAVTSANAGPDPYAVNLSITNVAMSESGNLAGGKVTYLDGHIANHGSKTVTGVNTQVIFRSYTHEIAQNETVPLKLISMRQPYIDTVPISAAPLKPGSEQDFRLTFDQISADWDGGYPEVRILHVDVK